MSEPSCAQAQPESAISNAALRRVRSLAEVGSSSGAGGGGAVASFAHALPEHRRSLSLDDQRRGRDKAKEQAATTSVQAATAEDLSCSAAACGQQSNLALGRGAGGGSRQEEQTRCVQAEHKRAHHSEERARRGDEHADHGLDEKRARREPQIARVAPLSCSEPPER